MHGYRHECEASKDHIDAHKEPERPGSRTGKSRENDAGQNKIDNAADKHPFPTPRQLSEGWVCAQRPPEGCRQQESRPAQAAGEVQAGRGAWTAEPVERHNDRHHHELHRLAAALGSGFLCRSGAQEARLDARIREGGRRARLSLRAGVAHRPGEALRGIEKRILAWHRSSEACRRLEEIPGIGPIVATALIGEIGDWTAFSSGRSLAA